MVTILHKPGSGAEFPKSAIDLVTIPCPDVKTVGISEIAVALFRETEAGDRDGSVDQIPLARPDGHSLEVNKDRLIYPEQDVAYLGLPVDDTTR
jgi:hypothetical protein